MFDLEFNQAHYTESGVCLRLYQLVDDFGDLLGMKGIGAYPETAYRAAWAYFCNGG